MSKRDLLLQEMNITQWHLRYPERLKGAVNIDVDEHIRLIMLTEQNISPNHPLLQDVLRSLEWSTDQLLCVSFAQLPHLNVTHKVIYWLLSDDAHKDQLAKNCTQATALWHSPSWQSFQSSPQAKRQLWQQMQLA